jgi:hypothetical protein
MLLEANLTESHKTDVRDNETKFFDEIKEKQVRDDKEPRSQFYGISIPIMHDFGGLGDLNILENDGTGFLRQDFFDPDYTATNGNIIQVNYSTLNNKILGLDILSGVDLIVQTNIINRPNGAISYNSAFNVDIVLTIYNVTGEGSSDYIPFLQVNLGKIIFDPTTSQFFKKLSNTIKFDLSETVSIFSSTVPKLTNDSYDRLINGTANLAFIVGFDGGILTPAQKQMMQSRIIFNTTRIIFLYKGVSKL